MRKDYFINAEKREKRYLRYQPNEPKDDEPQF